MQVKPTLLWQPVDKTYPELKCVPVTYAIISRSTRKRSPQRTSWVDKKALLAFLVTTKTGVYLRVKKPSCDQGSFRISFLNPFLWS